MRDDVIIRLMREGEEREVCALVARVFDALLLAVALGAALISAVRATRTDPVRVLQTE